MSLRITKCKIWGSRSAIKSTERHLELSSTEYNPFVFIILKITRLKIPHLKKVCSNKIKSVKHISEDEIPRPFYVCVVVVFGAISTSAPWTAT